jgi:hypothetical protein
MGGGDGGGAGAVCVVAAVRHDNAETPAIRTNDVRRNTLDKTRKEYTISAYENRNDRRSARRRTRHHMT